MYNSVHRVVFGNCIIHVSDSRQQKACSSTPLIYRSSFIKINIVKRTDDQRKKHVIDIYIQLERSSGFL